MSAFGGKADIRSGSAIPSKFHCKFARAIALARWSRILAPAPLVGSSFPVRAFQRMHCLAPRGSLRAGPILVFNVEYVLAYFVIFA